ncbi:MAG TPA: serine/threonine-protein kinase [Kofleriaceae bacterium]|nr:serine/threonine-protein kinase [Kofleriaceae bacterium]
MRERIGQGGMGSVFLADQPALGRAVVIKALHAELADWPAHARRMRDEATTACRVRSPHSVSVIDGGALADGTPFIVMQHVPGRTLGRVIAEDAISLARAVDLLDQILTALAAAHAAGVIHGDVKSDNFLVESSGGRDHVTLIDFGLARIAGAPASRDLEAGEVMVSGTPEYMAPEVIAGDPPIPASDLYGAGVILYELLTGAPPFVGGTAREIMMRHADDAVTPPSLRRPERGIPAAIDRVVLRSLHKRPTGRFADAAAFARELRAAAAAGPCSVVGRPPDDDNDDSDDDAVTPYAPTRECGLPLPRARLAQGSDRSGAVPSLELTRLRRALGQAIIQGNVDEIANGYLALAAALGGARRFGSAACELQEGIDMLTTTREPRALGGPHPVDRLIAALAALHDEIRDSSIL